MNAFKNAFSADRLKKAVDAVKDSAEKASSNLKGALAAEPDASRAAEVRGPSLSRSATSRRGSAG